MKTVKEVLYEVSRKYNSEGFDEMLYWQSSKIEECVLEAMEIFANQQNKELTDKINELKKILLA